MKKLILSIALVSFMFISCNDKPQKASYQGEDISKETEIIRDKNTKAASLFIDIPGTWEIYAGTAVENIDFSKPILKGNETGTYPLNVPDSVRSYFQLNTAKGNAIMAERHLPMAGGYNFRDLGGIKNKDGKYVKWGKIFRADELHGLTDSDEKYLSSIPIISIVDFRSQMEINTAPDKNPPSVRENYAFSIEPGNLMSAMSIDMTDISGSLVDSLMMTLNVLLVTDSISIDRYRDFFALLQDENNIPLLFHCTAGKDRTGMGAALILASLGVDEETIMQDYLLSNKYLEDKYGKLKSENPQIASMFEVKPEFLQAGLNKIKEEHGSIENFLKDKLNVDINKMRSMYLYE